MSTTTNHSPKPKRRWYQFSLKTEDAMKRLTTWILPFALLLVVVTPGLSAEPDDEQEAAVAALKKLGGIVYTLGRYKIYFVTLPGSTVTDALE